MRGFAVQGAFINTSVFVGKSNAVSSPGSNDDVVENFHRHPLFCDRFQSGRLSRIQLGLQGTNMSSIWY